MLPQRHKCQREAWLPKVGRTIPNTEGSLPRLPVPLCFFSWLPAGIHCLLSCPFTVACSKNNHQHEELSRANWDVFQSLAPYTFTTLADELGLLSLALLIHTRRMCQSWQCHLSYRILVFQNIHIYGSWLLGYKDSSVCWGKGGMERHKARWRWLWEAIQWHGPGECYHPI